jgi:translation elongation factor IF5A
VEGKKGGAKLRNAFASHKPPGLFFFPSCRSQSTASPVSRTTSPHNHPTMSDGEFENTGSGASLTVPSQASGIKKNGYMIIKGRPCKVVDCSTSKTGKHGSAKVHFTAIDIFNGKKYEEISPSTHTLQVPIINRQEYTLVDVDQDGFVSLMSADGCT